MSARTWLGLDPSIAATGWAVLTHAVSGGDALVDLGSWRTKVDGSAGKFADRGRRAEEIGRALLQLIAVHRPTHAFIEAPVLMPRDGKMSVHASARVRGLAEGICLARGVPLDEVTTQDVKRAVVGEPGASKEQVARRLFQLFGRDLRIETADDNATDALAVALVGSCRGASVTMKPNVVRYDEGAAADDLGF